MARPSAIKAYAGPLVSPGPEFRIISRTSQALYFGLNLGYVLSRTVSSTGASLTIYEMGEDSAYMSFAHNIHEDEQSKIDLLANVGKLISELQEFAKAVENLQPEGEE